MQSNSALSTLTTLLHGIEANPSTTRLRYGLIQPYGRLISKPLPAFSEDECARRASLVHAYVRTTVVVLGGGSMGGSIGGGTSACSHSLAGTYVDNSAVQPVPVSPMIAPPSTRGATSSVGITDSTTKCATSFIPKSRMLSSASSV